MTALDNVVLFKTDAEKDEGIDLAKQYTVTGFPTFVLMNADGETVNRWAGYGGPEAFIGTLDKSLADPITIADRVARWEAGPTEADAEILADYHSSKDEFKDAVSILHAAMDLSDNGKADYRERIFSSTAFGYLKSFFDQGDPHFTKDDVVKAADDVLAEPDTKKSTYISVAYLMQMVASRTQDPHCMIPYLKAAVERTEGSDDPDLQKARQNLLVDYTLHVEGDKDKAVDLKRDSMAEGWKEDSAALNDFAWWCFENGVNYEEAEAMGRIGVELAEPGKSKAMILDTVAELCHAQGKTKEALELMRQAATEDPDDEYFQKQVTRFEELTSSPS